ncbi:hypothetical protein Tco_1157571 [Tanacetum coccineum]
MPLDLGVNEAVHKEGVIVWQSQAPRNHGGAPAQTRSERVLEQPIEPPLSEGHTSGSGEGRMEHQFELTANELMIVCIKLSKHVLDLEKKKDAQAVEILRLKKRVESSNDDLDEEDASKQRRSSGKIEPIREKVPTDQGIIREDVELAVRS